MAVSVGWASRIKQGIRLTTVVTLTALAGCSFAPKEAGIGEAVSWNSLDGWQQDQQADVWPGLLAQCQKLRKSLRTGSGSVAPLISWGRRITNRPGRFLKPIFRCTGSMVRKAVKMA
ncbi:hypothetical protein [Aliamphritea spongicola]|nr:hypothetical protein [Aliamphritea spongicola]